MKTETGKQITIEATINAPVEKVWTYWNEPQHITKWNAAHESWHSPRAENDLRVGGRFTARMEARDGSMGFDFGGIYTEVKPNTLIQYTMDDERKVSVEFKKEGNATKVTERFDPESQNSIEMQRDGWQAILDNFKKYTESH